MKKIILFVGVPIGIDQLTKVVVKKFNVAPIYLNSGLINGICNQYPFVAIIINIVLLAVVVVFLIKYPKRNLVEAAGLLMFGGVTSNLIDRAFHGGVIDYIKIGSLNAFNLADIVICASLVMLVGGTFYRYLEKLRGFRKNISP